MVLLTWGVGRRGVGSEIVYCGVCGDRILEREFEKGRAVTVLKKNYCSKCAVNVTVQKSPTPGLIKKARTQKIPKADPPSKWKPYLPFMLAAGIAVVAVVLLIVVLAKGSH